VNRKKKKGRLGHPFSPAFIEEEKRGKILRGKIKKEKKGNRMIFSYIEKRDSKGEREKKIGIGIPQRFH